MKKIVMGIIITLGVMSLAGFIFVGCSAVAIGGAVAAVASDVDEAYDEVKENIGVVDIDVNNLTISQQNTLESATNYLVFSGFSKEGLEKQLKYDGYEKADIDFVMNLIDVDWSENAIEKAKSYLEYSSFSRDGLKHQLEFDGFTAEEAESALTAIGY
jgi:colicin import membrane protein